MSKIAGELNAEIMKKVIHDRRAKLFAEIVAKTGSKQSVIDRAMQEIESLREQVEKLTKERDECRLKCEDRKDAERYNKLVAYLISDCTEFDDAIIAARTRDEMNTVIDTM